MKALVGAFNQEKALVGAFSVIVKTDCEIDGALHSTTNYRYDPGEIRTAESRQTLLLVVEVRFPWLMMALDGLDGC